MLGLKRDPARVIGNLKELDDGSIMTKVSCRILTPERYASRMLANIGTEIHVLGFLAIIMENEYYGVCRTAAMMRIKPSSIEKINIDGAVYYDFHFDPGDIVVGNVNLVMNDTLTYYIYNEHVAKGNIPAYFEFLDLVNLLEYADIDAGVNLGNPAVLDLIISTMCRNPNDLTQLYRHIFNDTSVLKITPPTIVPFRSVIWNTSDTTSKLIGAYFGDSITSALVNPTERTERIESLLRL